MTFQVGHKKFAGRPMGAKNKRTKEFLEILEASGFCPATALMDIYKISMARFAEECAKEDSGRISPMESNAVKYLKIAGDHAAELASYSYTRLKAIEHQRVSVTEGMSAQEKLEASRMMVKMLEEEVKSNGSESS
jgi:hypothetical protein